jgi:hypothetical protein
LNSNRIATGSIRWLRLIIVVEIPRSTPQSFSEPTSLCGQWKVNFLTIDKQWETDDGTDLISADGAEPMCPTLW